MIFSGDFFSNLNLLKTHRKVIFGLLFIIVAAGIYWILPANCPEAARRTAFIFIIAALFWAFEIFPLYATSILVILLLTFLLAKPDGVLKMGASGYEVFLAPFASPIMMIFFGGFVLAEALRKYQIDLVFATKLLRKFGSKPYFVMLGFMLTTAFLSMWISNTATAALMFAMATPLLLSVDKEDPFRKGLILAIAFAANIGGIVTPIGTPPNAIAIGFLADQGIYLRFLNWFLMMLPIAFTLLILNSFLLYYFFRPKIKYFKLSIESPEVLNLNSKVVLAIAILTALLWLTSSWHQIPEAVVALVCVALLMGFGFFDYEDLKKINWDILVLMWGGLALGIGMEVSGLAEWIVRLPFLNQEGFLIVIYFAIMTVLLSTFMSNTATVSLMMPLVMSLPDQNPIMLASVIALASSFDIPIPIATPPMAMAYATREIKIKDMLKVGIPFTIIANLLILVVLKYVTF